MVSTEKNCNFEYKICLLGDSGVGKSSVVQRFVHETFNACNENTIGASFMTKTVFIRNTCYKLNIWDTAGQERYKALTPMYYRGAHICIVVYDVTSKESFYSLQNWIRELKTYLLEKCLICIVGNKCDLNHKRVVSKMEAKEYADKVGAPFIETSAKNAQNINELFINGITLYQEMVESPSSGDNGSSNSGGSGPFKNSKSKQISLIDRPINTDKKCC